MGRFAKTNPPLRNCCADVGRTAQPGPPSKHWEHLVPILLPVYSSLASPSSWSAEAERLCQSKVLGKSLGTLQCPASLEAHFSSKGFGKQTEGRRETAALSNKHSCPQSLGKRLGQLAWHGPFLLRPRLSFAIINTVGIASSPSLPFGVCVSV